MRKLWTKKEVSFKGKWHDFQNININPLPIQQPIPLWMGSGRTHQPVPPKRVLRRIGKYADGVMPLFRANADTLKLDQNEIDSIELIRETAVQAGRDPSTMKMEISLYPDGKSTGQIHDEIHYLLSIGATHVHFRPGALNLKEQICALQKLANIRDSYLRLSQGAPKL